MSTRLTCSAKELNPPGKQTRSKTAVLPKPPATAAGAKTKANPTRSTRKNTPPPPSSSPARLSAAEEKVLTVLKKKQRDTQLQALKDHKAAIHRRALAIAEAEAEANDDNVDDEAEDTDSLQYPASPTKPHDADEDEDEDDPDAALFAANFDGPEYPDNDDEDVHHPDFVDGFEGDEDTSNANASGGEDDMEVDEPDNNILFDSSPTTPSKRLAATDRRRRRQALSISPSRTSANTAVLGPITPVLGVVSRRRRSGKITNNHFTPRTLNLALAGKKAARKATAVTDAFPVDKMQFFLGVLQQLAAEDKDGPLNEAYIRLLTNVDLQKEIVLFIGYARGGIFTGFISRARQWAPSRFGLPGTMTPLEVKELVAWLLHDGHFKYGGIDVENRTYNTALPFGCEGISQIMRQEIFATKGGANIEVFQDIVRAGRIRSPSIALMLTVIEHALNEYSEGTHRHAEFSDAARSRYLFHLSSYNKIAFAAPTWADDFETSLFKLIITQSNKAFLLDIKADDLSEVDIGSLEAAAKAAGSHSGSTAIPTPAATTA